MSVHTSLWESVCVSLNSSDSVSMGMSVSKC